MSLTADLTRPTLVVSRRFAASPERLFDAWFDPKAVAKNRDISSERVPCENVIAMLKRFKIIADRYPQIRPALLPHRRHLQQRTPTAMRLCKRSSYKKGTATYAETGPPVRSPQ
jgi:hypothetical protein